MYNPKDFYRKLDKLLTEIYTVSGKDVFHTVLKALIDFLGADLHILDGRIYEDFENNFNLIFSTGTRNYNTKLPLHDDAIKLIIKHGCYIFDDPAVIQNSQIDNKYHTTPAAIEISNDTHHWIFIFELDYGWEREEIQFCLNTVRKALNSRIESEQVKNYISQAELIQKSLLPVNLPDIQGFEIAARSIPTEIVGGDLYDITPLDSDHFCIAVGDASGHGLPAALLVRDVVTGLRMGVEKHLKMTYTLERLNKVIHRSRLSTSFVSLFYAEIESNGNIIYVNAGHPSPILIHRDGFEEFNVGGLVLGPLPKLKLKRGFKEMEKDDILVLYTDGLIERHNSENEQFGLGRLKNIIFDMRQKSASEIVDSIFKQAYHFGAETKWIDDVTVVIVKKLE